MLGHEFSRKSVNTNEKPVCRSIRVYINGRNGGIRTRDPLHPMQVRYQAALHSEDLNYIPSFQALQKECDEFLAIR